MKNWEYKKLGDVCDVIAGQSPEGKYYNQEGRGTPFYQGKKDFGDKYLGEPTTWTTVETKIAIENDILMSVRAPVGDINICNSRVCIGRGLAAIRASKNIDEDYLFYFLLSEKPNITGKEGAVFASINRSDIANLDILVPPLDEQKRIVKILDEKFAQLETVKANAKANLQNAKDLFQSQLTKLLNSNPNWIKKTLGETVVVERGSSPRPIKQYLTDDESGVNWVKIGDTKNVDKVIYSTKEKITQEGAKKSRFVKKGDFILSNSMSLGKPYIMGIDGYIHDGWFVLRLPDDLDTNYFFYLLSSDFVQTQFTGLAAGAIVKNISSDLVKKSVLILPPLPEQKRIIEQLDSLSEKVRSLEEIYTKQLANCDELKQAFLAKAFAGEL